MGGGRKRKKRKFKFQTNIKPENTTTKHTSNKLVTYMHGCMFMYTSKKSGGRVRGNNVKDNFFVFEGKQQYLFYVMNYMCCVVFIDYKIKPGGVQ